MNPRLAGLQSYPFEKLAQLIHGITPPPGKAPVRLSVGEPQHAAPAFVLEAMIKPLPASCLRAKTC
jgi:N-succinyldiaminopimelate aminotransferase